MSISARILLPILCVAALLWSGLTAVPGADQIPRDEAPRDQAAAALRRAVDFYRTRVASHGGYLWRYSADLTKQEGEGTVSRDVVWVQPPGTPAVGMAYLDAYERTGEAYLLEAAREVGECLVRGQLRSGGWASHIDFDPEKRKKSAYRVDAPVGWHALTEVTKEGRGQTSRSAPGTQSDPRDLEQGESGDVRHALPAGQGVPPRPLAKRVLDRTTFDDDKTQSALRMLMRLDKTLGFNDARVHEAAVYALAAVLQAQYANGAWPHQYDEFPDPQQHSARSASYPESWPREFPKRNYSLFYTFNDGNMATIIATLLLASDIYGDVRYREAALRGGDFMRLAQMPEPQPAWAQQYDLDMHPAWARKFEPPAITGGESQGVIESLLMLYEATGERRFLEPVPRALDYLRRSTLPDGRQARFYELKTNRPLYFTKKYELTYDDGDMPTHYGFKVASKVDALSRRYERLEKATAEDLAQMRREPRGRRQSDDTPSASQIRSVIEALDGRGAWVEDGRMRYAEADDTRRIIDGKTFIRNLGMLSRYVAQPQRTTP